MDKIKVVIVDDNEIFRKGVEVLLNTFRYYEIVAIFEDGAEFYKKMSDLNTDVILMDIKMPRMDGITATKHAIAANPEFKIIVLSMFGEESMLKEMIKAGVKGFLLKDIDKDTFDLAIRTVNAGGNYFAEEMLKFLTRSYLSSREEDETLITRRELEVLTLIAQGLSNSEIAENLSISLRTVEGHKTKLISKTESKNIVDLLLYAIRNKIISVDTLG